MDLPGFKRIFFWEYLHRLIGRSIGLVFALPLLWFWWRRKIPPGYGLRLVGILALGGLQGAISWWMVASGLVDRPDVSHLRLATHLITALLIFSCLIWTALDLLGRGQRPAHPRLDLAGADPHAGGADHAGGLHRGTRRRLCLFELAEDGRDLVSRRRLASGLEPDPQRHRQSGRRPVHPPLVRLGRGGGGDRHGGSRQPSRSKGVSHALATLVAIQIGLGIATLLTEVAIVIAVAHQAVAALLLGAMVLAAHRIGRRTR